MAPEKRVSPCPPFPRPRVRLLRASHPVIPATSSANVAVEGLRYHVRPIRPDDGPRLVELHGRLSSRSLYLRFFGPHPALSDAEVAHFTRVDYADRLALVATVGDHVIGVGRYDRLAGEPEAEVAFVVDDAYQHHGVGSVLLDELCRCRAARGVRVFVAETMVENRADARRLPPRRLPGQLAHRVGHRHAALPHHADRRHPGGARRSGSGTRGGE